MSEITTVVDAANAYNEKAKKWIILPLHSSLSIAEQDKVIISIFCTFIKSVHNYYIIYVRSM